MVKKNFKGIDAFFGENTDKKSMHLKEPIEKNEQTRLDEEKEHLDDKQEKRATFIIELDLIEKLKAVAFWERKTSKIILKQCLEDFFSKKDSKYMQEALKRYRENNPN